MVRKEKLIWLILLVLIAVLYVLGYSPVQGALTDSLDNRLTIVNAPPQDLVDKILAETDEPKVMWLIKQEENGKETKYVAGVLYGKYAVITYVHRVFQKDSSLQWTFFKDDIIGIMEIKTEKLLWEKASPAP